MCRVRFLAAGIVALLVGTGVAAQAPLTPKALPERLAIVPATSNSVGGCRLGDATLDLNEGNVRARLYNTGGLFWRGGNPTYEVPKDSRVQSIFAAGIWVGGTVDGELRFAGADYADWEWWPGPLDDDGAAPADCATFDRIWSIVRKSDGSLTGDIADWPTDLGAPFEDDDGDGVYEPENGELPSVYGHQTAFWVMNDRGNVHRWSGAEPLGLTARVTAFSFRVGNPAFTFGTFYRYEFENPNGYTIENTRFGFFTDGDLGDFTDDYVGSDSTRGLAFIYNSDAVDGNEDDEFGSYGLEPPALGVDILSGAAGALYYEDEVSVRGVPTSGAHAYDYLNFRFPDGTPLSTGGLGYNPDDPIAAPTTWQWPGAPEERAFWSEFDLDGRGTANSALDRRFVTVAEPFELGPGGRHTVDLALIWAQGSSFLDSVADLRRFSDRVQAAYDADNLLVPGDIPSNLLTLEVFPNPATTTMTISYVLPQTGETSLAVYDVLGREVARFANGVQAAGTYRIPLRAASLSSGTYVIVLEAGNVRETKIVTLLL
ncbi:MAG: T9SS type A sorting domain-containing protein [Bacteroidota bacterium]